MFILIGDFNSEMQEDIGSVFCIDLILTNEPSYFQTTTVIETGISDFHKLTVTVLKSSFRKQEPKIFSYRNYKKFNNENFRNDLLCEISKKVFTTLAVMNLNVYFVRH